MSDRRARPLDPLAYKQQLTASLQEFGQVMMPGEHDPPILSATVQQAAQNWFVELSLTKQFDSVKVQPRRKALFTGPPGCGKTTLGHHVAVRLGKPLVVIDSHRVIDKYLGSTGRNIGDIFRRLDPLAEECVVLFDEFDSLALRRTDTGSDGGGAGRERNAIVNALLIEVERYKGVLIAATNFHDNIDPAIWRRFPFQLRIDIPDIDQRFAIAKRYTAPLTLPEDAIWSLALALEGATPALIRDVMESVRRDYVLAPMLRLKTDHISVLRRACNSTQPHPDLGPIPIFVNFAKPNPEPIMEEGLWKLEMGGE